jgi:hypothetical protein
MGRMKLVSILNVWSDTICLLPFCIKNHLQFCDGVIVIWSQHSNHWNKDDSVLEYILANGHDSRVRFEQLEPMKGFDCLTNETRKRNHGLDLARRDFTHFIVSDADEFYHPQDMERDKAKFFNPNLKGLVSALRVHVGKPEYWCEDHTLVPTIHKLTQNVNVGRFMEYPFAYDDKRHARIDPSRRPSFYNGIEFSETIMHHYSYVRKNIDLKIDNSSANLRRSRQVIYDEMRDAKPGYMSKLYHQPLKESPNYFDIAI